MEKRRFVDAVQRNAGPEPAFTPSASALESFYEWHVAEYGRPPTAREYRRMRGRIEDDEGVGA